MARIFCAVLSTIAAPPIIALLLGTALLAACASDDRPRPMHIAAEVEGEAVKVEVRDIPTDRKITGLALVDATGHETPAREREIVTREESGGGNRSEEHTSELQSLMRISYAVFCLQKKNN